MVQDLKHMQLLCYCCEATAKQFPAHVLLSVMRVLHMFPDPVPYAC